MPARLTGRAILGDLNLLALDEVRSRLRIVGQCYLPGLDSVARPLRRRLD